jgi:exopolysaccharide production protein ExoZ
MPAYEQQPSNNHHPFWHLVYSPHYLNSMTGRIHNLDYLRGLAASGIMIFHYLTWTFGEFNAESFMGRVGLYGVSIFYVLSGLTLFYVYYDKMKPDLHDLKDFFSKRFFRIMPLLWLATIASVYCFNGGIFEWKKFFLNMTGLFGFVDWDNGIAIGVWSIGNELVFYLFFPVFILLSKKFKPAFILFGLILFALYVYFAFFLINNDLPFDAAGQKRYYVNPLNQVFLFLSGFLIGLVFRKVSFSQWLSYGLIVLGSVIFIFYPSHGDRINLVADFGRMALTLSCILICIGFYKVNFNLPKWPDKGLKFLGEASFSIYLLHPIIHRLTGFLIAYISSHLIHLPESIRFLTAIIFTFIASYFVYQYFEKFFIRLGKKITSGKKDFVQST